MLPWNPGSSGNSFLHHLEGVVFNWVTIKIILAIGIIHVSQLLQALPLLVPGFAQVLLGLQVSRKSAGKLYSWFSKVKPNQS